MPVDPSWIPSGWKACDASCTAPKREEREGKSYIWCECVSSCLNIGRCGCRLVRRKRIERDPDEPDGWRLGPPEMVEETCEERATPDALYLYKCLCLERLLDESRAREQRRG